LRRCCHRRSRTSNQLRRSVCGCSHCPCRDTSFQAIVEL
jgi:hypothetical protein